MKRWMASGLAAVCIAAMSGGAAQANEVVQVADTFGTGGSYDLSNGWFIGGSATTENPGAVSEAAEFTPSQSGELAGIDVAAYYFNGGPGSLVVSIWTDSSGAPGTELGSWTATASAKTIVLQSPLAIAASGVALTAGTDYFLELGPGSTGTQVTWQDNPTDTTGPIWSSDNKAFTGAVEAFSIQATVPEPRSWALAIGGLGLAGLMLRRRREALNTTA